MKLRLGSMCTGYGGLDIALGEVLDVDLRWVADNDPGASAILDHHWPQVKNLGDITAVDWATVEPVDILAAGFPCTDVSLAGLRAGMREGTRSGIWVNVAQAIATLRPSLVVIENVRGLLSARADSDVEPCEGCLGDVERESVLRACAAVCGDLASLGFDAVWRTLPASGVGAPHKRERVFVLAWTRTLPTAATHPEYGPESQWSWLPRRSARQRPSERCRLVGGGAATPADTTDLRHERGGVPR